MAASTFRRLCAITTAIRCRFPDDGEADVKEGVKCEAARQRIAWTPHQLSAVLDATLVAHAKEIRRHVEDPDARPRRDTRATARHRERPGRRDRRRPHAGGR